MLPDWSRASPGAARRLGGSESAQLLRHPRDRTVRLSSGSNSTPTTEKATKHDEPGAGVADRLLGAAVEVRADEAAEQPDGVDEGQARPRAISPDIRAMATDQ